MTDENPFANILTRTEETAVREHAIQAADALYRAAASMESVPNGVVCQIAAIRQSIARGYHLCGILLVGNREENDVDQ